jgi:type VI secretion system secreted protein VgrG
MGVDEIAVALEASGSAWDGVEVARVVGREEISSLFELEVTIVVPPGGAFDADQALAAEVDLVFTRGGHVVRRLHAIVAGVDDLLLSRSAHRSLRLHLRPRLERLALVETQAVFLATTVPALVAHKLELAGFVADVDFRFALSGKYPQRDIVVQYRETDLAFVSRITEHVGISFSFEHVERDGAWIDRVVFTDQTGDFPVVEGGPSVRFVEEGDRRGIVALEARRRMMPSFWAVQDYDERYPTVDLLAVHERDAEGGGVIDYAPHVTTPEEARALVEVRAQEREALCRHHVGESHLPELAAGSRFELADHPAVEDGTGFLVVAVEHEVAQVTGLSGCDASTYRNRFRAVRSSTTYRPARKTPRPRVHGVLTGMIAAAAPDASGAIAHLDDGGRYRVRFLFDNTARDRPAPSHPIRQLQHHAGAGYGTHFPLKPETEVQIAFHDGDPDRPMIVGAVPNAVTPSPVSARDADKHRIKTAAGVLIEMGEHARAR